MEISWERQSVDSDGVRYFVDAEFVGEDDLGFDQVLRAIEASKSSTVILKAKGMIALGGGSSEDSLPFSDRLQEFKASLGTRKLIYEMF